MKIDDLILLAGIASVTGGVGFEYGAAFAAIAGGALFILVTMFAIWVRGNR